MNNSPGKVRLPHSATPLLQRAGRHLRQQIHRGLLQSASALLRTTPQGADRVRNRVPQLHPRHHPPRPPPPRRLLLRRTRRSREDARSVPPSPRSLRALLSQRQRDLEAKNESYANSRKADLEKGQLGQQVEKLQRELKRAENEKENLGMKLKVAEKTAKENQYHCRYPGNASRRRRTSTSRSTRPSRPARRSSRTRTASWKPPSRTCRTASAADRRRRPSRTASR